MFFLQQLIRLLSESPNNIIYHLVTLFALQAAFALAFNQWRHQKKDDFAYRTMWAAGTLLLARIGFMMIGLLGTIPLLLPLEQAIHTLTAVLLIWALGPRSTRWPRLGETAVILSIMLLSIMTFSFSLNWQTEAAIGSTYADSTQVVVWGIVQVMILFAGFLLTVFTPHLRRSLRLSMLIILLVTHVISLLGYPQMIPNETGLSIWPRLGHLIVFPLWIVLIYRHTLTALLAGQRLSQTAVGHIQQSLQLASQVNNSLALNQIIDNAIRMVTTLTKANFVALALPNSKAPEQLHVRSNWPQPDKNQPQSWNLNLNQWPALRLALEQKQGVELIPNGRGARQLHDLYEELGTGSLGALFIQPLLTGSTWHGFLLVASSNDQKRWSNEAQNLMQTMATYLGQTIHNAQQYQQAGRQTTTPPVDSGRIIALEEERQRLQAALQTANDRYIQAEKRATEARQQTRDIAATLDAIEQSDRNERIVTLEAEIETLRESLIQAEEAMALAAAGEGGLSTEWIMTTITRYSGQLEEAQNHIQALEKEIMQHAEGPSNEVVASLSQELRTPMTSIAGYSDLLLEETIGNLSTKQREFLQRVKANVARMSKLLDQLIYLTTNNGQHPPTQQTMDWVDIREAIDVAIDANIAQIRRRNLQLALDIGKDLPLLCIKKESLQQILVNLLNNACQSSGKNGRVTISAHAQTRLTQAQTEETINFMHITITDSGRGIHTEDWARVFDPQYRADHPLITGLGERDAGLAVARTLIERYGGRIWLDSELEVGSTFSVLFPIQAQATL